MVKHEMLWCLCHGNQGRNVAGIFTSRTLCGGDGGPTRRTPHRIEGWIWLQEALVYRSEAIVRIYSRKQKDHLCALHGPLNVVVDDVRVDLSGGYPGVSQNVREVEQVSDELLIF